MLKRIHVTYVLKAPAAQRETIARVHAMHHKFCPVYRSIHRAIDVTTEWRFETARE